MELNEKTGEFFQFAINPGLEQKQISWIAETIDEESNVHWLLNVSSGKENDEE